MIEIEITGIRKDNGNHENPYEAVEAYRWVQHSNGKGGITNRQTVVDWMYFDLMEPGLLFRDSVDL